MKKCIIALMGLFTLAACSEDTYQEADNRTETGTTENDSGDGRIPLTVSSGYSSPFQPAGSSLNKGIVTTFRNSTPLYLELEPYGEDMHVQNFLAANSVTYPITSPVSVPFFPIPSTKFVILPGTVETNADTGAPLAVNAFPFTNSTGTVIYDFGSWSPNWRMYHQGKIYYFRYKIFDSMGNVLADGYIKHKFYDDNETWQDINAGDPNWDVVGEVPNLTPMYDVVVMYHTSQDEMCLTNRDGYTTPPLPSSVDVVDPVTGAMHTLEFTSNTSGIYVNFN